MLLQSYEEDIKQISSQTTNYTDTFLVNFSGIALRLKKMAQCCQVSILVYSCHPLQQTIGNSFNA